jgi:hypothetical protein
MEGHGKQIVKKKQEAYIGEFKNGFRHGEGELKSLTSTQQFLGTFKYNKLQGPGKQVDISGALFEGEFVDN